MHQFGPPIHLHLDGPFYVGIGFCSHLPDKSDTAVLSNVVLESSAGKVRSSRREIRIAANRRSHPPWLEPRIPGILKIRQAGGVGCLLSPCERRPSERGCNDARIAADSAGGEENRNMKNLE